MTSVEATCVRLKADSNVPAVCWLNPWLAATGARFCMHAP